MTHARISLLWSGLAEVVASALVLASLVAPAGAEPASSDQASESHIKTVLELFTSQGCSSCPPADALLHTYAERGDIIALTMPVDYWDYLGWKDTLASPKFSARQRAYAKDRGDGRVYTPQMIVNGTVHVNGRSQTDIDRAIAASAMRLETMRVAISAKVDRDGHLRIQVGGAAAGSEIKEATVWLAIIQKEVEIPVRSGENHGKTLKYYNVVRDLTPIGMWDGKPAEYRLNRDTIIQPGAGSCAILMQRGKAGPILGAALLAKL